MSTCRWCTPSGPDTTEFLKHYAAEQLSQEEFEGSNDDLCYCLECVVEYHKAREECPRLHKDLWDLETSRLVAHIEKSMQEEMGEDDELFLVDENGETRLSGYVGPDFENNLRVPLLEILKYPYLLLHERVSELCVEVLCRMELGHDSFQVFEKYPGIYLFLVHPNEVIRRWAILTARNLGKVDRDDYYDLEEVLTCLFKVIELGLFENPDIYSSSMYEKGKLILLPAHLYDATNYKNYWLGICMLLSVLEEQAMDSLLLGPDKQNDFMQSILHTMEKEAADDSADPFWPALHCFMVILDQLGSKVWGQLIDPVQAFQTIINSESYKNEIRNIRSSFIRTKTEPESDYGDDMITCSQIVYNYNTEKPQKDAGWKAAICPEYCPNMYEDMQTLANVLQSDIGRDMRVHHSTFLWFIPFVQSLMDLKELGVAYIVEVIHYLCSEIKDILIERIQQCDKISEFFLLILVSIVELHRSKKCLHLLWISSQEWVEAVVRCAMLPARVFTRRTEKAPGTCVKGSSAGSFQASNSVQHACVQLIRSLLKEGYQIGQQALCKRYLDKLNLLLRGNLAVGWQLNIQETQELQTCLKQVIRNIKGRALSGSVAGGSNSNSTALPAVSVKQEKNVCDDGCKTSVHERGDLYPPFVVSKEGRDCQGNFFPRRKNAWEEESGDKSRSSAACASTERLLMDIKKEPNDSAAQESIFPQNSLATKVCGKVQENRNDDLVAGKCNVDNEYFNSNAQCSDFRRGRDLDIRDEAGPSTPVYLSAQTPLGSSSSRSCRSVQETSVNSMFQSKLAPTKQVSKETSLDCSTCPKNEPCVQEKEGDSILHSGINDTSLPKVSTEEKSLLKPVFKKNTDTQSSDWEQPNLNDLAKYNCKHQISNTFCTRKASSNGYVPCSSESKRDMSNPASRIRPLSVRCGSSDRLFEFSEYFKRQKSSEGKKEDFVKVVSGGDTLSDSKTDKELDELSLAAYSKSVNSSLESNQESSVHHSVSDLRRKVKGAVRSSKEGQRTSSLCDADCPDNQVIIISDSSDEEKGGKMETKDENVCPANQPSTPSSISDSDTKEESESSRPPFSLDDCDSQLFEFESDAEVFSVWQDTQAYAMEATQEYKQDDVSAAADSSSDDFLSSHMNEWGYHQDYLSDDTMEEASSSVEKQREDTSHQKETDDKKEVTNSTLQESVSKEDAKGQLEKFADKGAAAKGFTMGSALPEPRASTSTISLASKLANKKNSTSPQKNAAKPKSATTLQRSPRKTAQNKKLPPSPPEHPQAGRSMPAVVPPRKVRQCPAPASTAEKLGLKKGPRKAFDLSQRSLESVVRLRSHGKAAGRVGVAQKLRTKLIDAQSLSVKHNKKLLACQDRQFLRQMRPKRGAGVKSPSGSSESGNKKGAKACVKSVKQKPESFELASVEKQREEKIEETSGLFTSEGKFESLAVEEVACASKMPGSSDWNRKWEDNSLMAAVPVDSSLSSTALGDGKDESSGGSCTVLPESESSKQNECKSYESNEEDDDNLFLTQLDPVDMELCSEEESVQDTVIAGKAPEEVDVAESLQQNESLAILTCRHKECMEKVEKPGESCSKHTAASSGADHVFAKPSLLPPKVRKPSTTKIFCSPSSSRNAAFSRDLEEVKKVPPPSKSKVNAAKQVVVRPPQPKVFTPLGNQTCKAPSFSNVPQPHVSNNVLQSQNRQYDNALNISRGSGRGAYSSFLGAQQRDYSIFVNQVLKWTYEMFANFSYFGTPNSLLQSIVASVPVQFQDYNDYFNTFFPLMMLNAFETLAQEWLENQKLREKSYCFTLENFSADMNTAHFTAHFRESDLARQLHPKEDDLILLVLQRERDSFGEETGMENRVVNHVGLVTRFARASGYSARQEEQHTVCHLTVQTRGNLSFCIHKQVRCVVVGSLVTTHRTFKGLLLLSRSPLARPIINPCYNDFCPRDLPVASASAASCTNEYNEDQKRAIETAYAMVKQHPGLPKICLIHGPPGTGKSKTIVGLLSRVLRENTRNEKTARKKKPNRFLVCAPSNAAVDELMKKIIVAFKEKCQNKQEPLGNCGDIKLVRLGAEKAINNEVRGFSLDKQVEHRMKRKPGDSDQDIQKKKAALDQKLDMLSRERAMHRCEKRESQMLDDEIGRLAKERQQLASQLKKARGHSQKVQADIILESDIICCTLSTSGGSLLESAFARQGHDPFSCVIVDEAGQSCEVETLIPLIHRCNKLVLVGDPKQLPPTVKSVKAQQYGYDQSLMARLQRHLEEQVQRNVLRSLPVVQLTVQYRMHPDICLFPSSYVYGKTLKTAKAIEENRCSSDWPFQPYLIFDVADGREERDNDSYSNPREVKLVMELIRTIKEKRKDLGLRRIGIITPYSAQKKKIQDQLDSVFRNNSPGEVDTVDAFQGREKDCIIVSCVRANSPEESPLTCVQANSTKGSIGFLASLQRLNVTITRARFSLFILGRLQTLMEDKNWNHLIQDAQKRGAIIRTTEKNYKKDALKILKLRPALQAPAKAGTVPPPLVQAGSSSAKRAEPTNPGSSLRELPAGPGHAGPQGNQGPPQPPGAPATDSRRGSVPASMGAPATDSRRGSVPASMGAPAADSRRGSVSASVAPPAADSRRGSVSASVAPPTADSRRGSVSASVAPPTADSRRSPAPVGAPATDSRRVTVPVVTPPADSRKGSVLVPVSTPATDSRRGSVPVPVGAPAADSRKGSVLVPVGAPATDSRRVSVLVPVGAPAPDSRRGSVPVPVGAPAADSRRGSVPVPVGAPAADSKRGSVPVPVGAATLPANPEKPRDPRLATLASRTETKGKEQALKDGSWSAQGNPGSASQQGLQAPLAARDQTSRPENFKKAQQTVGQCNVLSTSSYTAQHEADRRGAVSKSISKAPSERGQSSSSEWNKDCRGFTRRPSEEPPENTESSSIKRRKIFH